MPPVVEVTSPAALSEYNAVYHMGVVPGSVGSSAQAIANVDKLTAILNNMRGNGDFAFADRTHGPVLKPVVYPAGQFYFKGTPKSGIRANGKLRGIVPPSWGTPAGTYGASDDANGGIETGFNQIDPAHATGCFRMRSTLEMSNLEFRGQPYESDSTGEGPLNIAQDGPLLPRTPAGIEIEAHGTPPTSLIDVHHCTIQLCDIGIRLLGGYYGYSTGTVAVAGTAVTGNGTGWQTAGAQVGMRIGFGSTDAAAITTWYTISAIGSNTGLTLSASAGTISAGASFVIDELFVAGDLNADNSTFSNISFKGCPVCVSIESAQAVCLKFRDIQVDFYGGRGWYPMVLCDCIRGGWATFDGVSFNQKQGTVFRVHDFYGAGVTRLVAKDFRWDRAGDGIALTLFEHAGSEWSDMSTVKWHVRIDGGINIEPQAADYDEMQLIKVPKGKKFPVDDMLFDIQDLPTRAFTRVGSRWKPGPNFTNDLRGWWRMDEGSGGTIADKSGKGGTALLSTSPAPAWATGKFSGALNFTHNAAYASVPDSADISIAASSGVMFWCYVRSYVNGVVLSKFHSSGGNPQRGFRTEASGFYVSEGGLNRFSIGDVMTVGSWHHVALMIDSGGQARIYVDGVEHTADSPVSFTDTWFNTDGPLRIGAPAAPFYTSGSNSFDGMIEDLRLFATPPTVAELLEIKNWSR